MCNEINYQLIAKNLADGIRTPIEVTNQKEITTIQKICDEEINMLRLLTGTMRIKGWDYEELINIHKACVCKLILLGLKRIEIKIEDYDMYRSFVDMTGVEFFSESISSNNHMYEVIIRPDRIDRYKDVIANAYVDKYTLAAGLIATSEFCEITSLERGIFNWYISSEGIELAEKYKDAIAL